MRLKTVTAIHGADWVRHGFRVFGRKPLAFAALFAIFLFALLALALVPYLGAVLLLGLLPVVTVGFMSATRIVLDGRTPTVGVFIEPLRGPPQQRRAMLMLGLFYAASTLAAMWLADRIDGGAFEHLMASVPQSGNNRDEVARELAAPGLGLGMALRFGLPALLSIPFWHAPALVLWDGHSAAKALFSSTVACWRNRGAFTVYGLAWIGLVLGTGIAGSLLFGIAGQPQMFAAAAVPLSLVLSTVFYASLYFTFTGCFVATAEDIADTPA